MSRKKDFEPDDDTLQSSRKTGAFDEADAVEADAPELAAALDSEDVTLDGELADVTVTEEFALEGDGDEPFALADGDVPPLDEDDAEALAAAVDGDDKDKADTSRVQGWGRIFRGNKLLWIMSGVAVLCLVAGLLAGRFVLSPADAAQREGVPDPGLITAPVEFGALSNDVTIRADVGFSDPVEVKIDASSGVSVVTGQVPKAGATFKALSIALEVGGRPVIVLPGELPAYRTLRIGVSGPDVLQLKQALSGLGYGVGDVKSNVFDQALADAVGEMYKQSGYPAPPAEEGAEAAYDAAEDALDAAGESIDAAEAALTAAQSGPTNAEIVQADGAVSVAETALSEAKTKNLGATAIAQAQADYNSAIANRDGLWVAKDTTNEQNAVNTAYEQQTRAQEDVDKAAQALQPYLPQGEVLYLSELPRRVDEVKVSRGDSLSGAAMTVSGANIAVTGSASEADGKLLKVGDSGTFQMPDDTEKTAKISKLEPGKDGGRWNILLEPEELTPEEVQLLQGQNIRVKISVGASEGEVLSVPLAALTAGPGGESRVEVVDSDPRDGEEAETHMVVVELGLTAAGFVEVRPTEGKLEEGDLVVVGE